MLVLLLVAIFSGMPIAFAVGLTGVILIFSLVGPGIASVIGGTLWSTTNSFILVALPLFIFMSEILGVGGVSGDLFTAFSKWFGRVRGGLLLGTLGACAAFSAMCGSSPATAATIGIVALPELEKRGYDTKLSLGTIAAGGTLGILIPPSLAFIVYGSMVNESVGALFMAGVIPGVLLTLLYMAYIGVVSAVRPDLTPVLGERVTWRERIACLRGLWGSVVIVFVVLGTIYMGIMTPTESAAAGAVAALAIAWRKLTWATLVRTALNAMSTTVMIMFIIVGAQILTFALAYLEIPQQLAKWVLSLGVANWVLLILIYFLYLVLGCLMDGLSMMILTLPVVLPLVTAMGLHLVWFGVVLVILIEIGLLTPPVGLNLFVLQGLHKGYTSSEVIQGSWPFIVPQALVLTILTLAPQIPLWLPSLMK